MTPATSGPESCAPLAFYDPEAFCWRTSQGTFPWDSTPSLVTLPRWGTTRAGALYARPTPALPTAAPAFSLSAVLPTPRATRGGSGTETMYALGGERSDEGRPQGEVLMPTPSAADGVGGHLTRSGDRSEELLLPGVAKALTATPLLPTPAAHEPGGTVQQYHERLRRADGRTSTFTPLSMLAPTLLPTPLARDGRGPKEAKGKQGGPNLSGAVALLPTPTATDAKASGGSTPSDVTLTDAVVRTSLGASTNPRFAAGNASSDDQPPGQLTLDDAAND